MRAFPNWSILPPVPPGAAGAGLVVSAVDLPGAEAPGGASDLLFSAFSLLTSSFPMKCPKCNAKISDKNTRCLGCGFDALSMDDQLASCPLPQGHVNDFAGVLSPDDMQKLKGLLEDYKKRSGHDMVVVTVKHTRPLAPAQYVFWLYNEWGVGGKAHQGVMILLALEERRIESEVGFGLEKVITDERSGEVLDNAVVPHFKAGRYGEGLCEGAKAIIQALSTR